MSRSVALALTVGTVLCVGGFPSAQDQSLPNVKERGRATVEYRDKESHVVASYNYSQKNHESPWLLIQLATSTTKRIVIHRDHLKVVTPDGREVMVASQQRFLADSRGVRSVVQNAQIWSRQLDSYFSQRQSDSIRFFSFPGEGVVNNSVATNIDHVNIGDLFFEMPGGGWSPGNYRLVITHEQARAALPIRLD